MDLSEASATELENLRFSVNQEMRRRVMAVSAPGNAIVDKMAESTGRDPRYALEAHAGASSPIRHALMDRDSVGGQPYEPAMEAQGVATDKAPRSFAPPRTIGWAIKQLHNGARVQRSGWNGRGQWLAMHIPDGGSFMTLPYIYIRTVNGDRVPWLASQTDLLATDWRIA